MSTRTYHPQNAWYTRNRDYHNGDYSWKFECYGEPSCFWLQLEYLEIRVYPDPVHPSVLMQRARNVGILYAIAERVRMQEYDALCALGMDPFDAHTESWMASRDVIDISTNPHPQFYCTTEAKMITGKGVA